MEVHHHPHVEKKSFKEYILEGLMIFIAVSMGFVAEGIRESITDHEKEEQFMSSLVYDLKKDTANLSEVIDGNKMGIQKIDTFLLMMNNPDKNADSFDLFRLAYSVSNSPIFKNVKTTLVQLKSSGSLRLVKNIEIANAITNYDLDQETLSGQGAAVQSRNHAIQEMELETMSFANQKKWGKYRDEGKSWEEIKTLLKDDSFFVKKDADILHKYTNLFILKQFFLKTYVELMEKQKSEAIDLLKTIQEHYHIEK